MTLTELGEWEEAQAEKRTDDDRRALEYAATGFNIPVRTVSSFLNDDDMTVSVEPSYTMLIQGPDAADEIIRYCKMVARNGGMLMAQAMESDAKEHYREERAAYERYRNQGPSLSSTEEQRNNMEAFERKVYRSFGVICEQAMESMAAEFKRAVRTVTTDIKREMLVLQDQLAEVMKDIYEDDDEEA